MIQATTESRYTRPFWRWYAAILLMLIYSCSMMDRSVAYVVVQPVKAEFHLSDGQIGLMTGFLFGVANGIAGLILGPLVDRVNRRNFLGGLLVLWSLAASGAGLAPNFAVLLSSRFAVGAAEAGAVPSSLSMLANISPPRRRSTVSGVFFLSAPLGAFFATAGGGLIAAHWGWRAAFFAAGLPGLLLCALMMATLPEPDREPVPARAGSRPAAPGLPAALAYIANRPSMALHYVALILLAFAAGGKTSFIIAFFMRAHQMTIQAAGGLIGAIGVIGGLAGAGLGGVAADRLARRGASLPQWWLAGVAAVTGIADLTMVLSPNLAAAIAAASASAFIGTMWLGPGYGLAASFAPEHMRGKALALLQVGANLATGAGALIVGVLSEVYGGPRALNWALATVCSALFVVSGLFGLAAVHNRGPREQA